MLPAERIVAVGDLLEHGEPWIDDDTDTAGWAAALDSIAALGPAVYVPSHGPAVRDERLLEQYRAHFRGLLRDARAAVQP